MRRLNPKFRAYKGPMVVLALAATLIVAFALPKAVQGDDDEPQTYEIASRWDAEVKRVEVKAGDRIEAGAPLLVLVDPTLEDEILRLENELKILTLGSKEAVVETGMLGSIGSLPRVVWTNSEPITAAKIKTVTPDTSAIDSKVKGLSVDSESASVRAREVAVDVEAAEAAVGDALLKVQLAETDAKNAEQGMDAYQKEWDKQQRLYDIGAIPKKKLDASVEAFQTASADLVAKKSAVKDAQSNVSDLEKQLAELRAQLKELQKEVSGLSAKLDEAKTKASELRKQKETTSLPVTTSRPTRKIVYGTAPESLAPVQVNLVDVEDPEKESKIAELRSKIVELRKKRDSLRITAPVAGFVKFVIEPGTKVANLDSLVVISPTASR